MRDDRKLSAYAKPAWLMLWSRQPDIRPSMRLLAADMRVSRRTAHKAVRELESAGLVKVATRESAAGDPDTNEYVVVAPEGVVQEVHHPRCRRCTRR
jgi:DNA-binding transcriptional MocR family regulator